MIFTFVLYIRVSRKSENTTKLMMMWTFVEKLQGLLLQHWHININIHNNNYNNNKYIMRMVNGMSFIHALLSLFVFYTGKNEWKKWFPDYPRKKILIVFAFFLFCISTWRRNHHIIATQKLITHPSNCSSSPSPLFPIK